MDKGSKEAPLLADAVVERNGKDVIYALTCPACGRRQGIHAEAGEPCGCGAWVKPAITK